MRDGSPTAWTTDSASVRRRRPPKLRVLLDLAQGCRRFVELGTATAWTAISLLEADPGLAVVGYDVVDYPQRDAYLALSSAEVRARFAFVHASGRDGPRDAEPVDLLYVDAAHDRDDTLGELAAWRSILAPGAIVVFDDIDHPDYPGVRQALDELGLSGEARSGLFIHRTSCG